MAADELPAGDVHVWVASLECAAAELADLGSTLGADEHACAARFCFSQQERRFIARRGLRRAILAMYLGAVPAELQFRAGPNGKPELVSDRLDSVVRFNCSHSGDVAVVAVARHRGVGVDVERLRPVPDALAIANDVFSPVACERLAAMGAGERDTEFLIGWTRAEACVKASGDGLSGALAPAAGPARWEIRDFAPAPGYVAAVAADGSGWNVRYRRW